MRLFGGFVGNETTVGERVISSHATILDGNQAFGEWWQGLSETEQEDVAAVVILLEKKGPHLGFPHTSGVKGSRFRRMRELRIQHKGEPYRVLYAFDPRRVALLLMGGNKGGDERWYEKAVPLADRIFQEHLEGLGK